MKSNSDIQFTKGLVAGALVFVLFFLVWHVVLLKAGEIDIDRVIQQQSADSSVLFSSGINQNAFSYKIKLMGETNPEIMAIGSSRAMQFRQAFFNVRFLNMGGTVSHVADLEQLSAEFYTLEDKPELVLLLIDPWWFNPNYPAVKHSHISAEYPDMINVDLILNAIKAFTRGNWMLAMMNSNNLGIHSILTGEGFSVDGSYHYSSTVTSAKPATDVQFSNTLSRIKKGTQRFEKANYADSDMIKRACDAIKLIEKSTSQLVVVAPPFSKKVWDGMEAGGYEYMQDAYSQLESCTNIPVNDYSDPDSLMGSNDCEFVDGFHGGDTTAARMLMDILQKNAELNKYIDQVFVNQFIGEFSGNAAGITSSLILDKNETDFLNLGCQKQVFKSKIDRAI
ncbi:hypothetical protein [Methylicorpusculum sp.]|uniref:hypothetical protein n=1 Tax=Methylicorpusculum sp. TaxID=2713644 RepID=UPI002ABC26DF|nr:hypothetical protein [Methylicorpusculum sp.]MDZ4154089.1 hypothetical protein [Methylicorpusculum sp.]